MKNLLTATLAAVLLSACTPPQQRAYVPPAPPPAPEIPRVPFSEAEHNALKKTGTGGLTGQAFLRTEGGDVKTAAGSTVYIEPATSVTKQRFEVTCKGRKALAGKQDPRADKFIRETIADAEGKFKFNDLPPGAYYLITHVRWSAPTRYGLSPQGGWLMKRVDIENKKTAEVLMIEADRCAY
ncbi:prealbumin-like fold domain-containing protein [Achromobacter animicus]|uniref:prealbumin-like fold domain-containing protein n=1 Tax=Achromobacter animicus TaxID=1389935 RepID=UPI001581FC14|nr:prealbumin-like fold domain-containing protein [Achromobacter animicus]